MYPVSSFVGCRGLDFHLKSGHAKIMRLILQGGPGGEGLIAHELAEQMKEPQLTQQANLLLTRQGRHLPQQAAEQPEGASDCFEYWHGLNLRRVSDSCAEAQEIREQFSVVH